MLRISVNSRAMATKPLTGTVSARRVRSTSAAVVNRAGSTANDLRLCRSIFRRWPNAAAAFGQRRKMLRQSLKSLGVDPTRLTAAAHVDVTRRAETVPVSGFVAMARELTDIRNIKLNMP